MGNLSMQKVSDLQQAVSQGDNALPKVVSLLDSGISVNCMINQRSLLYFAIERDRTLIAELLLARGASIKVGYFTETPLHIAAARGNLCLTTKLVRKRSKLNARNHNGCTPLWLAVDEGHYEVVDLLLQQQQIDVDCPCGDAFLLQSVARSSTLCRAVLKQHADICEALIMHGADVDFPNIKGCTPLHHACCVGNAALASLLIRHGCSLNPVDGAGYTPLHVAVNHDHCSVVRVLIQAGCDINLHCTDPSGFSPLHTAAKRGNPDIVAALCSVSGIQVDSKDSYCATPLIVACKNGNAHCLQELLFNGADVNVMDGLGLRPLSLAVSLEEDPRLRWRLQRWQLSAQDKQDGDESSLGKEKSASDGDAALNDQFHSRRQTDRSGAQIGKDYLGLENVIWSVARSVGTGQPFPHVDVLHVLLIGGADLELKDTFNKTAMEYALSLYGLRSVLMLLCHGATISEEFLRSFLATNYSKPREVFGGFIFPLVVALAWSSVEHYHFFHSYHVRFSAHNNFYELPSYLEHTLQQPMSLARHCRSVVRESLIQNSSKSIAPLVQQLPVPKAVKQFLLLSDVLQLFPATATGTQGL